MSLIPPASHGDIWGPEIPTRGEFDADAFKSITDAKFVDEGADKLALVFIDDAHYISVPCPEGPGVVPDIVPTVRFHGPPPTPFYQLNALEVREVAWAIGEGAYGAKGDLGAVMSALQVLAQASGL